jgi:hypothetical protein
MSETRQGLITDSVAYLPSSSTPTQTHDFVTTSMVMAVQRQHSRGVSELLENDFGTSRIMIFNIAMLLSQLGSLMICTRDLYVLTKRKKK